jgi:hypothetical protein
VAAPTFVDLGHVRVAVQVSPVSFPEQLIEDGSHSHGFKTSGLLDETAEG